MMRSCGKAKAVLLLAILLECAIGNASYAADNATLVKFAKANADKYASEVTPVNGVTTGSLVTVSYKDLVEGKFDGTTLTGSQYVDSSRMFSQVCRTLGKHIGQNGFGAKFTVEEYNCDDVYMSDTGSGAWVDLNLTLSPNVYRQITKDGVQAEAEYVITSQGLLVNYHSGDAVATPSDPETFHNHIWDIAAKLQRVIWHIPGRTDPLTVWGRAEEKPQEPPAKCPTRDEIKIQSDAEVLEAACAADKSFDTANICGPSAAIYYREMSKRGLRFDNCK